MGDIIKTFQVRSVSREKPRLLKLYFDTGSPRTFVKQSAASRMRGTARLPEPRAFAGLGDGQFQATHMVSLEIKLLDLWVPHLCYVVPDKILDPDYDILLGHDFLQIYDIHVKPRQREVVVDRNALKMALKVRSVESQSKTAR